MQGLRECVTQGQFVLTAELEPPKGTSLAKVLQYATVLKDKVHAVNITDSPMANMRMSPIAVAHVVRRDAGLDAIFHLTCRDRNIIGLQSELLGAAALGVRTILVLTGDEPQRGDHPQAHGVFEVDSVGLVKIAARLNQGRDLSDNELTGVPDFYIGVAANPCADDMEREVDKLIQKLEGGAHFVETQPVYDIEVLARLIDRIKPYNVPVIAGILPLKSYKMTRHIIDEVPGIHIPAWLEKEMEAEGRQAGIRVARRLVEQLPAVAQGAHIMPVGNANIVLDVVEGRDLGWPPIATAANA